MVATGAMLVAMAATRAVCMGMSVSMVMAVRVIVAMMSVRLSGPVIVTTAVSAVWLEDTRHRVEHVVAANAAPAAVSKCHKIDNIADQANEGRNQHRDGINFKAIVMKYVVHSERCLDDEPDHQCPNENNAKQCAEHLGSQESKRLALSGRFHGQMDRHNTYEESGDIRKHVSSISHNGNGVRDPSTNEFEDHEAEADGRDEVELTEHLLGLTNFFDELWIISHSIWMSQST